MELFKLVGKIFVDSDEANKSISKTGDNAEGLAGRLGKGIGTAAKWAAGVTGAAVAVGGAMVAAAKDTAENMDVVDKASQRMKIDAESYQELAYAAGLSGVEMSTMEKAAKKLEGTDINMNDAMEQIMSIGDAAERSQKAAELFGESVAYQMTPLLNAGADGFAAMKKEANDLGLIMSNESVKSGADMNDMFSKIEETVSALKNSLMSEFMPYIMEILQWVIDNIPAISDAIKTVMDKIMPIVEPILRGVMNLVEAVLAIINGDFDTFVQKFFGALENFGEGLLKLGENAMKFLWDGMKSVWGSIKDWIAEKVDWVASKLQFWKKSANEMASDETDGSHASGLAFVPFDGYKAELHRGETVLNSSDASTLLDKVSQIASGFSGNSTQNISLSIEMDGAVLARKMFSYNAAEMSRRGTNLVNA